MLTATKLSTDERTPATRNPDLQQSPTLTLPIHFPRAQQTTRNKKNATLVPQTTARAHQKHTTLQDHDIFSPSPDTSTNGPRFSSTTARNSPLSPVTEHLEPWTRTARSRTRDLKSKRNNIRDFEVDTRRKQEHLDGTGRWCWIYKDPDWREPRDHEKRSQRASAAIVPVLTRTPRWRVTHIKNQRQRS